MLGYSAEDLSVQGGGQRGMRIVGSTGLGKHVDALTAFVSANP